MNYYTLSYVSLFSTPPQNKLNINALTSELLPELTDTSMVFIGWYYDTQYSVKAKIGDSLSGPTVLYAKWGDEEKIHVFIDNKKVKDLTGTADTKITYNTVETPIGSNADLTMKTQGKLLSYPICIGPVSGVEGNVYKIWGTDYSEGSKYIFKYNTKVTSNSQLTAPIISIDNDGIIYIYNTDVYTDSITVQDANLTNVGSVYKITVNTTRVIADKNNMTFGTSTDKTYLCFAAEDNYRLPDTIDVTGVTYTWEPKYGLLILDNIYSNVTINITATETTELPAPTNVQYGNKNIYYSGVDQADSIKVLFDDTQNMGNIPANEE